MGWSRKAAVSPTGSAISSGGFASLAVTMLTEGCLAAPAWADGGKGGDTLRAGGSVVGIGFSGNVGARGHINNSRNIVDAGGAGIAGSNLTIVDRGDISGGVASDLQTPANAITFAGAPPVPFKAYGASHGVTPR